MTTWRRVQKLKGEAVEALDEDGDVIGRVYWHLVPENDKPRARLNASLRSMWIRPGNEAILDELQERATAELADFDDEDETVEVRPGLFRSGRLEMPIGSQRDAAKARAQMDVMRPEGKRKDNLRRVDGTVVIRTRIAGARPLSR